MYLFAVRYIGAPVGPGGPPGSPPSYWSTDCVCRAPGVALLVRLVLVPRTARQLCTTIFGAVVKMCNRSRFVTVLLRVRSKQVITTSFNVKG